MTFSIVIPIYNKSAYIGRTIESVLHQTVTDFELIAVDDGSTDNSVEVVSRIHDDRVKIIQQPNGGEGAARNRGISSAQGGLICFLDADDTWEPWFLEEIKKLVLKNASALLFSTAFRVRERDGSSLHYLHEGLGAALRGNGVMNYLACLAQGKYPISSSSVCVRKEALVNAGYFDVSLKIGADIDMWTRVCSAGKTMYSPRVSATYHRDAENRSVDQGDLDQKTLILIEKLASNLHIFANEPESRMNLSRFIAMKAYETASRAGRGETAVRAFQLVGRFKSYLPLRSQAALFGKRMFR